MTPVQEQGRYYTHPGTPATRTVSLLVHLWVTPWVHLSCTSSCWESVPSLLARRVPAGRALGSNSQNCLVEGPGLPSFFLVCLHSSGGIRPASGFVLDIGCKDRM